MEKSGVEITVVYNENVLYPCIICQYRTNAKIKFYIYIFYTYTLIHETTS
jgi:hypothetical protein